MARYTGPKEKIERRIGEKLFLKGERSHSQKSAMIKKPYPPGMHGRKRGKKPSEYGLQLKSKQKVKNIYRLLEKQFKNYIKSTLASKKEPYEAILNKLEHRLDNVVFRSGFAQSRDQARQLVNHGHITVDGKKIDIASYEVSVGEIIGVREGSKKSPYFTNLMPQWLKAYEAPAWIELDKEKVTARVNGSPALAESGIRADDLQAIIEFYSR
ncbi:MAG: 30S ribosomal protein S4 [Candidatus Taylorbacteria bacterium]|nr:30S ribosomal protein S4 [Candidatus Taylorbacteria bacterium]